MENKKGALAKPSLRACGNCRAKQSSEANARLDCFVASLLAMTRAAPAQNDRRALFPSNSRYENNGVCNISVSIFAFGAFAVTVYCKPNCRKRPFPARQAFTKRLSPFF
jgi:hypothetical protein